MPNPLTMWQQQNLQPSEDQGALPPGVLSTEDRCLVCGEVQAECTPGREEDWKLENLAKTVSAARDVQAAIPICECSWAQRCLGPEPVLRTWIVISQSTSAWGLDPAG